MHDSTPPAASVSGGHLLTFLLVVAALAGGTWVAFVAPLNHDVAWGLYSARRVLEGARPYVDFVETNPPLFIYLSVPLEWMALVTDVAESSVLAIAMSGLTLAAIVLCYEVLRREPRRPAALVAVLLLAVVYAGLVLPGRDFAQREHALVLLIMPYCVLCARRAASASLGARGGRHWLPVVAGIMAGLGFALKPHFLLVWIAVSSIVIVTRRQLRAVLTAENVVIALVVGAYAGIVLASTPEYVFDVVPRVYQQYERAYGVDLGFLLADPFVQWLTAGSVLLLVSAGTLARDAVTAALIRCTASASLMFVAVYLVQLKGYYYHRFPAVAFHVVAGVLACAAFGTWLVAGASRASIADATTLAAGRSLARPFARMGSGSRHGALVWRTVLLTFAILPGVLIAWDSIVLQRALAANRRAGVSFDVVTHRFVDLVRDKAAGRPVFVLSTSVAPAFPLVNLSGATWPYRYNCLWPLPVHYRDDRFDGRASYRPPALQSGAERAFFDDVVAQLRHTPPALLIVDQTRFKQGFGLVYFDYVEYFQQSPAFADLFREYTPLVTDGPYAVYERRVGRRTAS